MANKQKGKKQSNVLVKKKKKEEKGHIVFLLFAVVMFLAILVSTIFSDVSQIMENKKETEKLNTQYNELLEEEASLSSEVVKLQDPEYVARYAREKFMYSKDGEKILKFIDEDEDSGDNEDTSGE